MTTTQAQALERLILALEGRSTHDALAVAAAISRVPGRTGRFLEAVSVLDDLTLAKLVHDGRLLELANAPRALDAIIADPTAARCLSW